LARKFAVDQTLSSISQRREPGQATRIYIQLPNIACVIL